MSSKVAALSLNCQACDDKADGQHFGVDACRACAAFFRRTIARQMKYVCRYEQKCEISKVFRCMCRACRLQKCLDVGMKEDAVQRCRAPLKGSTKPNTFSMKDMAQENDLLANDQSSENRTANFSPSAGSSTSSPDSAESYEMTEKDLLVKQRRMKNKEMLRQIVEIKATDYFVDPSALPKTHPILSKIHFGYELLQRRRDQEYGMGRASQTADGRNTRIYVEEPMELLELAQNNRRELNFIGEMLSSFNGFSELPSADKIVMFKHFWIHFIVLERTYDSFRVLGNSLNDLRMVFSYGIVVDAINDSVDLSHVTNLSKDETGKFVRTWWKQAAMQVLPKIKKLEPTEIEIMFCFGYLLFYLGDEVSKVSLSTSEFCNYMIEALYNELFAYYLSKFDGRNYVQRVGELMRYISSTERIVLDRKEDILICQMFKVFNVDIFLDEVFNDV
uniref:Uncharacterized protein n=1 Tax=Ditylenchus dipsaci TaxID=166011 RepID=A0A915D264_9BILA